jgi:hypothetical protein
LNVKQTVYFMALVGALAGLLCWFLQVHISDLLTAQTPRWAVVTVYAALMGALVAGLTVGFADYWSGDKVVATWVAVGTLLGALAGVGTGLLYRVSAPLLQARGGAGAALLVPWLIAGGLIGLATGIRWSQVNPLRTFHAFMGGLVGGGLGGATFLLVGDLVFLQTLAYVFVGAGITLGVTLAPVLLSDGVLKFVSSGDPRAQNKYGPPRQEWVVQDGDELLIGSMGASTELSMYSQAVQIYIPDALVAAKHAVLMARKKRFFIRLHPDNANHVGQPEQPLQLGDENVTGNGRELHNGDEIIVGQTLLRFVTRRKPSGTPAGEA